jgi:hypothetical protein
MVKKPPPLTPSIATDVTNGEVTDTSALIDTLATITQRVTVALIALVLAVTLVLGLFLWQTHNQINTILSNQNRNAAIAQCQVKTFNAVLKDVRLAFANDKNAAHYAKAVAKCG